MSELRITKGLPGSGKSTWARQQQADNPNLWRVNRDDLRAMVRPEWAYGDSEAEEILTLIQEAIIKALLEHTDMDVVVDDTNLRDEHVLDLEAIACEMDADFDIESFLGVPVEVCIARDAQRPHPVGEEVIRGMHEKYLAGGAQ